MVNFESLPLGNNFEEMKGSKRAGEASHCERPGEITDKSTVSFELETSIN